MYRAVLRAQVAGMTVTQMMEEEVVVRGVGGGRR